MDIWTILRLKQYLDRLRGGGISLPYFGLNLPTNMNEPSMSLVADFISVLKDHTLDTQLIEFLCNYYCQQTNALGVKPYLHGEFQFPILTTKEWIAGALGHANGFDVSLKLKGTITPLPQTGYEREYRSAIKELGLSFKDNSAFAVKDIATFHGSSKIKIKTTAALYSDYVFSAEYMNAELRLTLREAERTGRKIRLPVREKVGVGNFDRYMCKIGLNALTVNTATNLRRYYAMDRSAMVMNRPLEYPNAIHVVPAGTIQPVGKNYSGSHELKLTNTLAHEYAEEFFNSDPDAKERLLRLLSTGEAKFIVTALGLDALTQKLEICGLLFVPDPNLPQKETMSCEGLIVPTDRVGLERFARDTRKMLPAGALSIWEGIRYLDNNNMGS